MKSKILASVMLFAACMCSISVQAQLEVQTSGDVKADKTIAIGTTPDSKIALNVYKIGSSSSSPVYGIKSNVTMSYSPNFSLYGIYGAADARNTTSIESPQPVVGVYGTFKKNDNVPIFTAGVAGIAHWRGGIGVFGGINSTLITLPIGAKYAGYFNGTTMVNGTLLTNILVLNGDTVHVNNVRSLPTETANSLNQLHPVSYSFKSDSSWKYDEKMQREMESLHYGLIAQDVQKVLPELVYEREGGLSVNYIELIPLLIMKVQELSNEVNTLKSLQGQAVKSAIKKETTTDEETIEAVLYQNQPNPFSTDTKIAYQLPLTTKKAALYVYDMNGLQVAEYPIMSFGEGFVIVSAGALDAGMYLYSLIADGQIVDTKRMILTK